MFTTASERGLAQAMTSLQGRFPCSFLYCSISVSTCKNIIIIPIKYCMLYIGLYGNIKVFHTSVKKVSLSSVTLFLPTSHLRTLKYSTIPPCDVLILNQIINAVRQKLSYGGRIKDKTCNWVMGLFVFWYFWECVRVDEGKVGNIIKAEFRRE